MRRDSVCHDNGSVSWHSLRLPLMLGINPCMRHDCHMQPDLALGVQYHCMPSSCTRSLCTGGFSLLIVVMGALVAAVVLLLFRAATALGSWLLTPRLLLLAGEGVQG